MLYKLLFNIERVARDYMIVVAVFGALWLWWRYRPRSRGRIVRYQQSGDRHPGNVDRRARQRAAHVAAISGAPARHRHALRAGQQRLAGRVVVSKITAMTVIVVVSIQPRMPVSASPT